MTALQALQPFSRRHTSQEWKLVLLYIASRINDKEINQLKKAFKAFDKNNDGEIDYEEFRKGLSQLKSDKISEKEESTKTYPIPQLCGHHRWKQRWTIMFPTHIQFITEVLRNGISPKNRQDVHRMCEKVYAI